MRYGFLGEAKFGWDCLKVLKEMVDIAVDRADVDILFVLGYRKLLSKELLNAPRIGCIGSHPTLLPRGRGHHPIIWTVVKKLKTSGLTLFWLDEGVDSGDIWYQRKFRVEMCDADWLYEKATRVAQEILRERVPELEMGVFKRTPQDHSKATYWRKRIKGKDEWIEYDSRY